MVNLIKKDYLIERSTEKLKMLWVKHLMERLDRQFKRYSYQRLSRMILTMMVVRNIGFKNYRKYKRDLISSTFDTTRNLTKLLKTQQSCIKKRCTTRSIFDSTTKCSDN